MRKHVGLYNGKPVTIVMRKMAHPDEHMALVILDQKCPPRYFDALQKSLLSEEAQSAENFDSILEKVTLDDGRNLARILYEEGHFHKVQTRQVFATPYGYNSPNKIKLSDLNDMLDKISEGGDAFEKLKNLDDTRGMPLAPDKTLTSEAKKNLIKSSTLQQSQAIKAQGDSTPHPVLQANGGVQIGPFAQASYQSEGLSKAISPTKEDADSLRNQAALLQSSALQLLEQAKKLSSKADQLFPTSKRKVGRPKGSVKASL